MKYDEYINEEFEINPSSKAIEEILPEKNITDPGESRIADRENETTEKTDLIPDDKKSILVINANDPVENETFLDTNKDDFVPYSEDTPEAADANDFSTIEGISSETYTDADGNIPLEDAVADIDQETLFPPLFDTENAYEETDLFVDESADSTEFENIESSDDIPDNAESCENDENFEVEETHYEPDENNKPAGDKTEEKPRRVDSLFDFIELFVFTLAAVFIITSFFFRYSIVDGGSMQNTLQDDEKLILRSIFYSPKCGDIVVVQDRSTALKSPIVKRVIAVGGQTVKFTRDAVFVDGVELDEPYVYTGDYENPFGGEDIYRYSVYPSDALLHLVTDREDGVFYEITVPEGEIFVLGDHRNNSKDSREIGTLHEDAVIGKVVLRFFPFSEFGKIE